MKKYGVVFAIALFMVCFSFPMNIAAENEFEGMPEESKTIDPKDFLTEEEQLELLKNLPEKVEAVDDIVWGNDSVQTNVQKIYDTENFYDGTTTQTKYYIPKNFTVEGLPKLVYVGQKGKLKFVPEQIEGVEIEADFNLMNFDTSMIRIDEDGNWEALAPGYPYIYVEVTLSKKTKAALAEAGYKPSIYEEDEGRLVVVEIRKPPKEVYRLYNKNNGEHFYTTNKKEKEHLESLGWRYEGIAWLAPQPVTAKPGDVYYGMPGMELAPVFRLYNRGTGDHHYTKNKHEKDYLLQNGWEDEGIGWYSEREDIGVPLYRQYNPNAVVGTHNYTTNLKENNYLAGLGWREEGIAWYGVRYES